MLATHGVENGPVTFEDYLKIKPALLARADKMGIASFPECLMELEQKWHSDPTSEAVQKLISEHSIYEDELRRASGFRIYRPTEEGRSRCDLPKTSSAA